MNQTNTTFFYFQFEDHDVMPSTRWSHKYAIYVSSGISVAYLIAIFVGQYLMRNVPRKEVKLPLVLWNAMIAAFSIFGSIRTVPELTSVLQHHGFQYSICNQDFAYKVQFWPRKYSRTSIIGTHSVGSKSCQLSNCANYGILSHFVTV